jgi:uncharacterized protein YyaL (SSP411 family)
VVLTPAGDGFFAGTYFPKNTLISNLRRLQNVWQYEQNLITKTAEKYQFILLFCQFKSFVTKAIPIDRIVRMLQ